MAKLKNKTIAELKMLAKEAGIDLDDDLKKAQIVEALEASGENVITANTVNPSGKRTSGIGQVDNGAIGSAAANRDREKKEKLKREKLEKDKKEKRAIAYGKDRKRVAVYSEKNLSWQGVGKLEHGFNFVKREVADKWLRHRAVREATPEEVASHYGIK